VWFVFFAGCAIVPARSTFTHSFTDEQHSSGRRTKFATTVYFPAPFEALRNTCLNGNTDFGTTLLPLRMRMCKWRDQDVFGGRSTQAVYCGGPWRTNAKGMMRDQALLHYPRMRRTSETHTSDVNCSGESG
jgi:hypothetical protein